MNLKLVLMELGDRLVTDHSYAPGFATRDYRHRPLQTTNPIIEFTEFLNNCPEAQQILAELGIEWPVVKPR